MTGSYENGIIGLRVICWEAFCLKIMHDANTIVPVFVGVYSWIGSFREGSNFPQGDDLNGAAQALVRLQDTYRLNMASLTQGVVNPLQKSVVNSDSISKS